MISTYHTFNEVFVMKIYNAYYIIYFNQVKSIFSKVKLFQISKSLKLSS